MSRRINFWTNLDWITILIYLAMLMTGWISIYAAVYDQDHQSIFDTSQRYGKQLIWIMAAILIGSAILLTDNELFLFFSYIFYAFTMILLIAVLIFGTEVNASRSWFQFGSVQIQPAEFAKLATALALAQFLSSTKKQIHDSRTLIKLAGIIFLPVILILLQPDVGSAIVFFAFILVLYREGLTGWAILFMAVFGVLSFMALLTNETSMVLILVLTSFAIFFVIVRKLKISLYTLLIFAATAAAVMGLFRLTSSAIAFNLQLIISGIAGSIAALLILLFHRLRYAQFIFLLLITALIYTYSVDYIFDNVLMPHQRSRINIVLGIEDDPMGQSYNINQSKIAIGSGGLTGKGFLQGTQTKFNFVPEQSTDFIFCTIGEEWGFAGSFVLIALFIFLLLRLIFLAERQRSSFARIYGYSVIAILFTHIVINIGMTIGIVPVIGIPLPFISYGGSSLWAFTIMLFILLKFDAGRMEYLR